MATASTTKGKIDGWTEDNVAKILANTEYPSVQLGAETGTGSDGCEWSIYVQDDLLQR